MAKADDGVVVVGGGQAGAQTVMSLRQWGYDGRLTLVGDEPDAPYQRPPLSKAFLTGDLAEARLHLRPERWYADHGVDRRAGIAARAVDRERRCLHLPDGAALRYDALVIATGSRPRRLDVAGAGLAGVTMLRTVADARRIAARLGAGLRLAIVGAGYIGLEVAASARKLGVEVTVLELAERVLARVTSPPVSDFYARLHRENGVDLRCGADVEAIEGRDGRASALRLGNGEVLAADLVLVAAGIEPNVDLAAAAGLACRDGIVVDRDARSEDPRIYAVGDCSQRPLVHYGRSARLESVHNATEQGRLAAAAIVGRERPAEDVPWFWSDQYDVKLQIAGVGAGYDDLVLRGDPRSARFAVFYLRDGRLLAVDAINRAPEFLAAKQLIRRGAHVPRERLADPQIDLKSLAASADG